jgi:hypothetical protein
MDVVYPIIEPLIQSATILSSEPLLVVEREIKEVSNSKQVSITNGILIIYINLQLIINELQVYTTITV